MRSLSSPRSLNHKRPPSPATFSHQFCPNWLLPSEPRPLLPSARPDAPLVSLRSHAEYPSQTSTAIHRAACLSVVRHRAGHVWTKKGRGARELIRSQIRAPGSAGIVRWPGSLRPGTRHAGVRCAAWPRVSAGVGGRASAATARFSAWSQSRQQSPRPSPAPCPQARTRLNPPLTPSGPPPSHGPRHTIPSPLLQVGLLSCQLHPLLHSAYSLFDPSLTSYFL